MSGDIYVSLSDSNGTLLCGLTSIGEVGIQPNQRLKLYFDANESITTMASRAADHALELGKDLGYNAADKQIMVSCAYVIVNAGLAGEFEVGRTDRVAQATDWVKHKPTNSALNKQFIEAALTPVNIRAAATSLAAVKWNWYQTNHHIGQGGTTPFVRKYLDLAWGHFLGSDAIATTQEQLDKVMWMCGHWASTGLVLNAWGFDWIGEEEQKLPLSKIPDLVPNTNWDELDVTGRRFLIPADLPAEPRKEMYNRAKHFFDANFVQDRIDRRFLGTGCLKRVYPYGIAQGWVHQTLTMDADLAIRRDSFPAGTRPVSTSVAAVGSFIKTNSSVLLMVPDLQDFIAASAALGAIEEQQRPMYHMGAMYLTGLPRRTLKLPSLLGRAGMLVQACMENSAMSRSPMFKEGGKCQDAEDFDNSRLQQLRAFRREQAATAGKDVKTLLEMTESVAGEARHRAILTGIQMDYKPHQLRNVVKRCLIEAKIARKDTTELTDAMIDEEVAHVVDGIKDAKAVGDAAALVAAGGADAEEVEDDEQGDEDIEGAAGGEPSEEDRK